MTEGELALMERLWKEGATINEIANAVGYSAGWVGETACRHRQRYPYRIGRRAHPDRDMWMARLSAKRVTAKQVAAAMGVTVQTVYRWLREEKGVKP